MNETQKTRIGMLLYPDLTQLDLTGPLEVLNRLPGREIHLLWKDTKPVFADSGIGLVPTAGARRRAAARRPPRAGRPGRSD
ncbi:MAG: hypothetical protein U0271_45250 [Polyangiaceae bacterium]